MNAFKRTVRFEEIEQTFLATLSMVEHPSLFSHTLHHIQISSLIHVILLNFKAYFEAQNNSLPYCTWFPTRL